VDLATAAALHALKRLRPEQVLAVAHAALEAGVWADALGELAVWDSPYTADVYPIFDRALAQLGIPLPSRREALTTVARDYARRTLSGELEPLDGLVRIWQETTFEPDCDYPLLREFVRLGSELEVAQRLRPQLRSDILSAARRLIGETGPGDPGG
jgi:hypothetical protein